MKKTTYTIKVHCNNCNYRREEERPLGTRINPNFTFIKCPECGCEELGEHSLFA